MSAANPSDNAPCGRRGRGGSSGAMFALTTIAPDRLDGHSYAVSSKVFPLSRAERIEGSGPARDPSTS